MHRTLILVLAALLAAPAVLRPPSALAQEKGGGKKEEGKAGGKENEKGKGKAAGKEKPRRLSEGDEVGDLVLELAAGGSWKASAARGKIVVLVFAKEGYPESLDALKALGDVKGKTASSGAEVLGVLRDADAAAARRLAKDAGLSIPLAVDPDREAFDILARSGLPYTVVIDRAGKIALSTAGFDDEAVARKVEGLKKK